MVDLDDYLEGGEKAGLAEEERPQPRRFCIGDTVIADNIPLFPECIGEQVTIHTVDPMIHPDHPYVATFSNGQNLWFSARVKVDGPEPVEPRFRVGDRVITERVPGVDRLNGQVAVITTVDAANGEGYFYRGPIGDQEEDLWFSANEYADDDLGNDGMDDEGTCNCTDCQRARGECECEEASCELCNPDRLTQGHIVVVHRTPDEDENFVLPQVCEIKRDDKDTAPYLVELIDIDGDECAVYLDESCVSEYTGNDWKGETFIVGVSSDQWSVKRAALWDEYERARDALREHLSGGYRSPESQSDHLVLNHDLPREGSSGGRVIAAIKDLRHLTNMGLKDAKAFIEQAIQRRRDQ